MNPAQLLAHFDRVAEAPDAVPRLRRFVLDLAVRGKLVEQNLSGERASDLSNRRQTDEEAPLPTVADKGEFPLAKRWKRERFGNVLELQYGKALPVTKRHQGGNVAVYGSNGIVGYHIASLSTEPAIIIGRKGSAGALNVSDGPSWTTDVAYFIVPPKCFDLRFLLILLRTLNLGSLSRGVKPGLSRAEAYDLPIILPPLAEQHRIVAKVDELMALCDQLEAAQAEREKRRDRLAAASLYRLNHGADTHTFHEHARFHLHHLPRLTTRPEHIHQFRQTILNLAVRGKLVSQGPDDEPASELLKHIRAEKGSLIKEDRVKKETSLSAVDEAEAPFDLPRGWAWARFPELGTFGRGRSKHRPRNDPSLFGGGTHLLVQTGDVARSKGVIETFTGKYNEAGLAQSTKWPKGTLCITIAANIADSGILAFDACFPDSVVGFLPASIFPNARYFEYFIRTVKADLLEFAPATAQKNINIGILNAVLIPLPPLAEQHRIVAKVDELMALCDQLEAQLTISATESRRLLEAVLHEALLEAQAAVRDTPTLPCTPAPE